MLARIGARARTTGAAAAAREGDAHPAVAPSAGQAPAAAHSSALVQATPEMHQVQGHADAGAAAALGRFAHEAAPARSLAERARDVSGAAAARSDSHTAADDAADTPGSGPRGAGSGQLGSATQSAATPGVGPHAGGPCTLAARPSLRVPLGPRAWSAANLGCTLCCLSALGLCYAP